MTMIFSDWKEKSKDLQISKSILWEYDLSDCSWYDMRSIVMQRVIERGWMNDFYAALRIYGGISNVKEIIKDIPSLSDKDMTFVCSVFDLKKEDLRCYTRMQLRKKNTVKGSINDIKVDCISHNYPYVEDPLTTKDGIRLYGMKDIAAMKLSTIADDGSRLKDFIDIAFLSTKLSLSDMLKAYQQKYQNSNPIRPLKGLTYFEDINFNEPIQMIKGKYDWEKIEKRLHMMIKRENDTFGSI